MDSAGISAGFSTVLPSATTRPSRATGGVLFLVVRQLLPVPVDDVEPLDLYPFDARPRPTDRPWVMVNMVASVDGATAVEGVSRGLGGEGDTVAFRAIRASCDWIVAAAGTVRAERYRIPRPRSDVEMRRRATGRSAAPRLAVVTSAVELDPSLPLFADQRPDEPRPLVITGAAPPPDRVAAIGELAEWEHVPAPRPSPRAVIDALGERGAAVVLVEGGPSFNGQLVAAGLVDELCLTISPHLVGGDTPRIAHAPSAGLPADLRLDRLLEHDGGLFARYVRT